MDKADDVLAGRLDGQLLSDLWVFRAAARHQSITAASRQLLVTQGAVSQRVLRLEGRLGVPLFARHKGRIKLTDAGRALLGTMTEVTTLLGEALERINTQQRGALVVSCLPSLATEWLVPNLDSFYAENPSVEVFVRSELLPATADRMEDEGIDLCIDYSPQNPEHLIELAALQELIFPVCSTLYRDQLRKREAEHPVSLLHDDVPWIGGQAGDEWEAWQRDAAVQWPDAPLSHRHFNLAHLAYHAALCGQGIAVGRAVVVNRLLAKGELVVAFDRPPVLGPVYRLLAHRPGSHTSPVRRFASWWAKMIEATQKSTLTLLETERF